MEKGLFLTDRITAKVERQFEDTTGKKERAKSTTSEFISKLKSTMVAKVEDYQEDLKLITLQLEERVNAILGSSVPESVKLQAETTKKRQLRKLQEDVEIELNRLEDEMSLCVINDNLGKAASLVNSYLAIEAKDVNEVAYAGFNNQREAIEAAYNEVITPNSVESDEVVIRLKARKEQIEKTIETATKINQRVV